MSLYKLLNHLIILNFLWSFGGYYNKISDYDIFYGDPHNLETTDKFLTYELITPLFSDYAFKHRAIYIPKNQKIKYNDKNVFEFPVGAIISKTFYYPYDFNDLNKGISLKETRIMIHEEEGWIGLPYIWNEDETEAYLDIAGDILDAKWIDTSNKIQSIDYVVPNMNQCKSCHVNNNIFKPIGPSARQLNHSVKHKDSWINQLILWSDMGLIDYLPENNIPKIVKWDDPLSGTVNDRARAWLDINCAHCHNYNGPANNTGLFLDYYETNLKALGIYKTPVAAGRGSGKFKYDIVPGHPEESILIYRYESTDPGIMMPELGRTMVHEEGLELIKEWVLKMDNK